MEMIVTQGQIRDAFRTLGLVAEERSTNTKENLLRLHEDNQVLKTLLYYTFNTIIHQYSFVNKKKQPIHFV